MPENNDLYKQCPKCKGKGVNEGYYFPIFWISISRKCSDCYGKGQVYDINKANTQWMKLNEDLQKSQIAYEMAVAKARGEENRIKREREERIEAVLVKVEKLLKKD